MWGGKGALEEVVERGGVRGSGRVWWCEMSREGGRTSEGSLESSDNGDHDDVLKVRGKMEEVGEREERLHGRHGGEEDSHSVPECGAGAEDHIGSDLLSVCTLESQSILVVVAVAVLSEIFASYYSGFPRD